MRHDADFEKIFRHNYSLVTVNVLYFLPDTSHLVNEFLWQTLDVRPTYPRIHKFLNFWREEIDAVIKEVIIFEASNKMSWRNGILFPLN
jgi:uncharacterized protein Usg